MLYLSYVKKTDLHLTEHEDLPSLQGPATGPHPELFDSSRNHKFKLALTG